MPRPSHSRFLSMSALMLAVVALVLWAARATRSVQTEPIGLLVAVFGGFVVIFVLGALYEWIVHRYLYHHRSPVKLFNDIFEVHTHGHHWHRFPPDHYVEDGPIERIPVLPAQPLNVSQTNSERSVAYLGQFGLYLVVGSLFAFLPIWLITDNLVFTGAAIMYGLIEFYLFIRVHDVMHYPKGRMMERQAWFLFLDRHHYIHHIDNLANLNFLLPLGDFLFGTLRTTLTETEKKRWPSFEEARVLHTEH